MILGRGWGQVATGNLQNLTPPFFHPEQMLLLMVYWERIT